MNNLDPGLSRAKTAKKFSQLKIRSTVSTTNLTDVEAEKPKEKKFLPNIEKWQMVILVTVFALIINILAIYLFGTFFESRYRRGLEKGRILIVTGVMSDVADATKTEVIDLGGKGTLCDEHADFPEATSGAVGALMKEEFPLICGGTNTESDCYFFKNQTWHKATEKTSVKRIYSASVIDPTGNLWITGGLGEEASDTSEYIDLNADSGSVTSNFGPKLDMGGRHKHAMVKKAENRYMIIGGIDSNNVTKKTIHTYDFRNGSKHAWTTESDTYSLNIARHSFAAAIIEVVGTSFIVVAGGITNANEVTNTVEMIELRLEDHEDHGKDDHYWKTVKPLKHADWGASSIFLKNTETLLLIGGEGKDNNSRSHTHALTYQKYSESEWHWDERDKEHHLDVARREMIAMIVPDAIVTNCGGVNENEHVDENTDEHVDEHTDVPADEPADEHNISNK